MAGMAVMFVLFDVLGTTTAVARFFIPQLRDAEEVLPDVVTARAGCEIVH
ncbi:MAG: hypothetical protein NT102_03400 [Caldiserica bacterium]|nr:hypothetical protein [Caldisericota bacterium]